MYEVHDVPVMYKVYCRDRLAEPVLHAATLEIEAIPVKSYAFSASLSDFRQFSSLTAYGKDLTYFREKMKK